MSNSNVNVAQMAYREEDRLISHKESPMVVYADGDDLCQNHAIGYVMDSSSPSFRDDEILPLIEMLTELAKIRGIKIPNETPEPICLLDQLPPPEVMDTGDEEAWWWDQHEECWRIGSPFMFGEDSIATEENQGGRYSYWLPDGALPFPDSARMKQPITTEED